MRTEYKTLLVTALACVFAHTGSASTPFSGINAHVALGYINANATSYTIINTTNIKSKLAHAERLMPGLSLGYGYMLGAYHIGLDATYQFTNIKTVGTLSATSYSNFNLKSQWGLQLKAGLCLAPETLLYILGGPEWIKTKASLDYSSLRDTLSKKLLTMRFGLGIQAKISSWKNMTLGLEFSKCKRKELPTLRLNAVGLTSRIKVSPSQVVLRTGFYF